MGLYLLTAPITFLPNNCDIRIWSVLHDSDFFPRNRFWQTLTLPLILWGRAPGRSWCSVTDLSDLLVSVKSVQVWNFPVEWALLRTCSQVPQPTFLKRQTGTLSRRFPAQSGRWECSMQRSDFYYSHSVAPPPLDDNDKWRQGNCHLKFSHFNWSLRLQIVTTFWKHRDEHFWFPQN